VTQAEFGYFSIIVVPLIIISIVILSLFLIKILFNYPVFLWLFSVNLLNFFICVEENQSELSFLLRNIIAIMVVFLSYSLIIKIYAALKAKESTS